MALSEIAPYIAMVVTIIVWVLTQRENRRHEIFKERLKRRVDMFDGLLPAISTFIAAVKLYNGDERNTNAVQECQKALELLGDYHTKMLCYGTDGERHILEEFLDAINKRNISALPDKNSRLVDLVRKNLRAELGID
ncbi:MAG: hypothetical protein ACLPX9_07435 [Rhodomicrobium sp.]